MKQLSNIGIACIATLVALAIAELLFRTFVPEIGWSQRHDDLLGWATSEYKQFNPDDAKGEAGKRILFLGDSFLAGSGVGHLDERFPVLLQSQLQQQARVQILAAGGWGTDQELLAFKLKGKLWSPDLAVLAFCPSNDISNNLSVSRRQREKQKPYFVLDGGGHLQLFDGYGTPIQYRGLRVDKSRRGYFGEVHSYLFDFARAVFRARQFEHPVADSEDPYRHVDPRYLEFPYERENVDEIYERRDTLSWSPQNGVNRVSAYIHENFERNSYQWQLFEALIAELKAEAAESKTEAAILLLPVIFNPRDSKTIAGGSFVKRFETPDGFFTFRSDEPRTRLRAIAERTGVEFIDPTESFIEIIEQNNLLEKVWPDPEDRHFSALGHKILAELLRERMNDLIRK